MTTLTAHLQATLLSSSRAATQHAFLAAAGDDSLPHDRLALWLAQDRIYAAHAYPRFIGRLIASIPWSSAHSTKSPKELQHQSTLRLLVYALHNVVREVGMFDDLGARWNLDVNAWRERKETRDYTAEMAKISAEGTLEDGLVFLWAMEQLYLDSWRHVHSLRSNRRSANEDVIDSFASNWTNVEFEKFVQDCANVVNEWVKPGSEHWVRAEAIWARCIELEEAFWPEAGEETNVVLKAATEQQTKLTT